MRIVAAMSEEPLIIVEARTVLAHVRSGAARHVYRASVACVRPEPHGAVDAICSRQLSFTDHAAKHVIERADAEAISEQIDEAKQRLYIIVAGCTSTEMCKLCVPILHVQNNDVLDL